MLSLHLHGPNNVRLSFPTPIVGIEWACRKIGGIWYEVSNNAGTYKYSNFVNPVSKPAGSKVMLLRSSDSPISSGQEPSNILAGSSVKVFPPKSLGYIRLKVWTREQRADRQ